LGTELVEGGASRAASVRNALVALAQGRGFARVLIHDGARPFVTPALIARLVAALDTATGAAPALPVTDALWHGKGGLVGAPLDRAGLLPRADAAGFRFEPSSPRIWPIRAMPDDVEVALAAGLDVAIVEGEEENLKLTFPGDFARGDKMLRNRRMDLRMGNGYDVHAFATGDHVWLCGVKIPHSRGLLGHSDADVGMHALTDAIYGALAEGDIGRHFPPSDPQWKGAASHIFLSHAIGLARDAGVRAFELRCDAGLRAPEDRPACPLRCRRNWRGSWGSRPAGVSVKATTSERLGFTGREEGIAALATALLVQR
jgi:2-C-methyl-D-erythritol 4-phosphate cytidylyltransferase/2-C-methyl-D-erythritol 2,4-cyclodiphosphate synthase